MSVERDFFLAEEGVNLLAVGIVVGAFDQGVIFKRWRQVEEARSLV